MANSFPLSLSGQHTRFAFRLQQPPKQVWEESDQPVKAAGLWGVAVNVILQ